MTFTWSVGNRERKLRLRERQEQRRAEVYVDLLAQINREWIPAMSAVAVVVGETPQPLSADDVVVLRARLDAFASPNTRRRYDDLRKAIHLLVYVHGIIRERHARRTKPQPDVVYVEPPDVSDLSDEQLGTLKQERWADAQKIRRDLTDEIRRELGGT